MRHARDSRFGQKRFSLGKKSLRPDKSVNRVWSGINI